MKKLSSEYLYRFSLELRLLLEAGIEPNEGLSQLCTGRRDRLSRAVATKLCGCAEEKASISDKLEASGIFPQYFADMVRLGEKSGKLDDTLSVLSGYYKKRAGMENSLHGAVIYPLLLFVAMAAVVVVLITQVLPVFSEIYAQLGAQMTGLAVSLLTVGRVLVSLQAVILAGIAVFLVVGALIYLIPPARRTAAKSLGGRGVFGRISAAQFASAMSTAVSSGFEPLQAIDLAGEVCRGSGRMCKQIGSCKQYLECGEELEVCLEKARIFSENDRRLFSLGRSAGRPSEVMEEIARNSEEKVTSELEARLRKLGPAMIIAVSVIVGLTLLSVMLPTLGILSSLA